jgi:hypothetical protein
MTPITVKEYLLRCKMASLQDMVIHFDSSAAAIISVLEIWISKGKVKKHCGKCSGCGGCNSAGIEIYQWLG